MSRRRGQKRDSSPYKRKKTVESEDVSDVENEEVGDDASGALEPGQMAQLIVDMRNGVVDQQAANAIQGPLNDLAQAFAMQAEILRGVHDTQVELTKTLKKDKKAEMMVNATDSLNETFKGVRSTQQKLLHELDERGQRSRSTAVWALCSGLAVVVTIVGLFWWKDGRDRREDRESLKEIRAEIADRYDPLFDKLEADKESSVAEWKEYADRARKDLRRIELEKNTLQARNDTLERKLKEESGLSKAESQELDQLRRKDAVAGPEQARLQGRVKQLEFDLADALKRLETSKAEADHLRLEVIAKLNRSGAERLAGEAEDQNATSPIIPREEAVAARVENGTQDKAAPAPAFDSGRVIDDLNELMSNHRGSRVYQVEKIGAVGKHHLEDVVLTESAPGRGVTKRIRAKKLDVAISGRGDIVEFNFHEGDVQQKRTQGTMGPWTSFYNGRYRLAIYCLNGEQWMARNYGFFIVN